MPPKVNKNKAGLADSSKATPNTRQQQDPKRSTFTKHLTDQGAVDCIVCCETFTEEEDKLLQCERCLKWECLKCVGYSDEEYEMLSNRPKIHWFCDPCQSPALYAVQSDNEIQERCKLYMSKVTERITKLETTIEQKADVTDLKENASQLAKVQEKLENMENRLENIDGFVEDRISELERERVDQERRKGNLIMYEVPKSDSQDPEERKNADCERVQEILTKLDLPDVRPKNVIRLNVKSQTDGDETAAAKPKPTKVVFNTVEEKEKVLQRMQTLRSSEEEEQRNKLQDIHVAQDRTFRQRAEHKRLKESLEQRTAEGEKDLVIRNGRIVTKKPFRTKRPQEGGARK